MAISIQSILDTLLHMLTCQSDVLIQGTAVLIRSTTTRFVDIYKALTQIELISPRYFKTIAEC